MGQSVNASEQGLAMINQARQRRGWTKTSTARWWQDAHTSRATLRRFWRGERIQQGAFISICQAVGIDDWEAIAQLPPESSPLPCDANVLHAPSPHAPFPHAPSPYRQKQCHIDWGDAPDIEQFYDRAQELAQLQQWAIRDRAKLIHISGWGGVGKTTLAVAFVEQVQGEFERVIWRSIDNHGWRSIDPIDRDRIGDNHGIEDNHGVEPDLQDDRQDALQDDVQDILQAVKRERWLIVLDNARDQAEPQADSPLNLILSQLSRIRHHSCFVIISRHPFPPEVQRFTHAKHLALAGLSADAAVQLLHHCGCGGTLTQLHALARRYSYNPLALMVLNATIQTVFGGHISPFLEPDYLILPRPIQQLLQQQFETLSPIEKDLLFWLAIWQEPIAFCRLQTHLLNPDPTAVIEPLSTLVGRSLITRHFLTDEPSFSLQPMVMTFVTNELVAALATELLQAQQQQSIQPFRLWRTHCLVRPGTDDILGDRILIALRETHQQHYQQHCQQPLLPAIETWLQLAQKQPPSQVGYLTFNLTCFNIG